MTLRIRPLDETTGRPQRQALDALLLQCRSALVGRDEHLALVDERIGEAELDPERRLYVALWGDRAVGLVDGALFRPDSGAATIAHLAIDPALRHQGIGRALVEAVSAAARAEGLDTLFAATRPGHPTADAFWEALGFAPEDDQGPTRVFRRTC